MSKYILLALLCVALGVAGQISLKHGVVQAGGINFTGGQILPSLLKVVTNPFILLGLVFYAVSSMLWLEVLSNLNLSFAYPLISLGYVFSLIAGVMVFRELVGFWSVLGVSLIVLGVAVMGRG
ncbi:MAG: EamA family transporter [Chloroflexi bacterium]|nr:EamA family transporter [Chloroflexota bacterium]